jgi:hypothetical protein
MVYINEIYIKGYYKKHDLYTKLEKNIGLYMAVIKEFICFGIEATNT